MARRRQKKSYGRIIELEHHRTKQIYRTQKRDERDVDKPGLNGERELKLHDTTNESLKIVTGWVVGWELVASVLAQLILKRELDWEGIGALNFWL